MARNKKTPRSPRSAPSAEDLFGSTRPPERSVPAEPAPTPPAPTGEDTWDLEDAPAAESGRRLPERRLPGMENPAPPAREPRPAPAPREDPAPSAATPPSRPVRQEMPLKPAEQIDTTFEIDEELPAITRDPAAVSVAPPPSSTHEELDQLLSDDDTRKEEEPEAEAAPVRRGFTAKDKMSLVAVLALLGIIGVAFGGILYSHRPVSDKPVPSAAPDLPITGSVATISSLETSWRPRRPEDRVSGIDVDFPKPAKVDPGILPQVKMSVDPSGNASGFLKLTFYDGQGRIAGDTRVLKIENGALADTGRGEAISGKDVTIYCSIGFADRMDFLNYASNDVPRWTLEVRESTDYNANEAGWKLLDLFDLSNVLE